MAAEEPESIEIALSWVGLEEMPILLANHFIGQIDRGEFTLSFGQMTPPPLLGTPEQRAEQARMITFVPIRPVARVSLTRDRMNELIGVLQQTLQNHELQQEELRRRGQL